MKYNIWILSILLAFCGFNVHSQTAQQSIDSGSTYVISKQDLVTAIAQLLNNKTSQFDEQSLLFQERELRRLFITKQLMQQRMSYAHLMAQQAYAPATASAQAANPMIEHRLSNIESQLSYIANLVSRQAVVDSISRTHPYVYNSGEGAHQTGIAAEQYKYNADAALMDSLSKALLAKQNSMDTTTVNNNAMAADSAVLKMLEMLVAQNKALRNELVNMQQQAPASVIVNANTPQYTGEVDKVFFAHNSTKLNAVAQKTIQQLVQQLNSRGNLQVMVKGFASKVGKSAYNQELSLRRTDAVKAAIMRAGIDPGRVLSAYYGEDLSNDDEAYARRVEILYINSFVNK